MTADSSQAPRALLAEIASASDQPLAFWHMENAKNRITNTNTSQEMHGCHTTGCVLAVSACTEKMRLFCINKPEMLVHLFLFLLHWCMSLLFLCQFCLPHCFFLKGQSLHGFLKLISNRKKVADKPLHQLQARLSPWWVQICTHLSLFLTLHLSHFFPRVHRQAVHSCTTHSCKDYGCRYCVLRQLFQQQLQYSAGTGGPLMRNECDGMAVLFG